MIGLIIFIVFAVFISAVIYERMKIKKIRDNSWRHAEMLMSSSSQNDPAWNKTTIIDYTKNVFRAYYSAWASLDPSNLEKFLSDNFLKKTVLEMSVVKGLGRSFVLDLNSDVNITIVEANDNNGNVGDTFTAEITYAFKLGTFLNPAKMLRDKKRLLSPNIIEYWKFTREETGWQLDKIWSDYFVRPNLMVAGIEENIQNFAQENGFYYDPDFGKIMLPDKGKVFTKYNEEQGVSNHTIGMWDKKILEFYIYHGCYSSGDSKVCANYVVAQAILPKPYSNMIIESRKSDIALFSNIGSSLEKINTESVDFDKQYSVYRNKEDRVNVLELLPPNFMMHLIGLNFPVYIEIVDNILYVGTKHSKNGVGYKEMLEVLCWAFDEMKM
ncbi:DUF3137 domain-containing protein [bacterium]|nr:DUF3137 domain-containing protein [bacterium]